MYVLALLVTGDAQRLALSLYAHQYLPRRRMENIFDDAGLIKPKNEEDGKHYTNAHAQ